MDSVAWFGAIEFIQPRLGWVQYKRCATEFWLPYDTTWLLHAVWDALIVLALLRAMVLVLGGSSVRRWDRRAPILLGAMGMAQELALESTQTLWEYVPCLLNPQWATLNGRPMTLQQWHWSVIPGMVYTRALRGQWELMTLQDR